MTSAVVAGSTGLVGSHILSILLEHPAISSVHAYTRRDLPSQSPKLQLLKSSDNATWPSLFPASSKLFLSALGTTRGKAGSVEAQYLIDHDLNLSLAQAAKAAGCTTYVLISTAGANAGSYMAYPRMKGELEEHVKTIGFDHTVILRPGLLLGDREEAHGIAEAVLRHFARGLGGLTNHALTKSWSQDKDWVARAAVRAGLECINGKREKGFWLVDQAEVVRLGREPLTDAEREAAAVTTPAQETSK